MQSARKRVLLRCRLDAGHGQCSVSRARSGAKANEQGNGNRTVAQALLLLILNRSSDILKLYRLIVWITQKQTQCRLISSKIIFNLNNIN